MVWRSITLWSLRQLRTKPNHTVQQLIAPQGIFLKVTAGAGQDWEIWWGTHPSPCTMGITGAGAKLCKLNCKLLSFFFFLLQNSNNKRKSPGWKRGPNKLVHQYVSNSGLRHISTLLCILIASKTGQGSLFEGVQTTWITHSVLVCFVTSCEVFCLDTSSHFLGQDLG